MAIERDVCRILGCTANYCTRCDTLNLWDEQIIEGCDVVDEEGLDDLDIVELTMACEDLYQIEVPDEVFDSTVMPKTITEFKKIIHDHYREAAKVNA
jgi:acyl carrier protein